MIEAIIIYLLFPISIVIIGVLIWYINKILQIIENNSLEINERFSSFHEFMEETYKMDLYYGEPRLKELFSIIKEFHQWSEEFQNRVVVEKNDRAEED